LSKFKFLSTTDDSQLARHVKELRKEMLGADPVLLASRTASRYEAVDSIEGAFILPVWGQSVKLSFPDFIALDQESGNELPIVTQALLAYYFHTADGAPIAGRWISFSELPDGRFYSQAFQGYTGQVIARTFKDDIEDLSLAAGTLPRADEPSLAPGIGGRNFSFQALPRIPLLLVYWQGDEDFPSSYQLLFDAAITHYLPTDVCAILGSTLTHKLTARRNG